MRNTSLVSRTNLHTPLHEMMYRLCWSTCRLCTMALWNQLGYAFGRETTLSHVGALAGPPDSKIQTEKDWVESPFH